MLDASNGHNDNADTTVSRPGSGQRDASNDVRDNQGVKKKKGTTLKYVPINDFNLIPRYLVEQIKPKMFEADRFYEMAQMVTVGPLTILGAFVDKTSMVKGFLWATADPLTEKIIWHMLSVDKEYQMRGVIGEATNILKKYQKKYGLKGIELVTRHPRPFMRYGFINTNRVLMEG